MNKRERKHGGKPKVDTKCQEIEVEDDSENLYGTPRRHSPSSGDNMTPLVSSRKKVYGNHNIEIAKAFSIY